MEKAQRKNVKIEEIEEKIEDIAVIAGWIIYGEDAEWGNEWIVSRTGIQITTRRSKKVIFYEWSQINRLCHRAD